MRPEADEGLQRFLATAASHRLLTPVQEKVLARRIQAGDDAARREMIECNLRLVVSIARYYKNRGLPFSDVIQEGILGLDRAARKFDPERGLRFSTYATNWIRQSILRGLSGTSTTIRLPSQVAERRAKARAHRTAAGREVSIAEMAVALEMEPEHVRQALAAAEVVTSLDRSEADDDGTHTLLDTLSDPSGEDPYDDLPVDVAYLYDALSDLPQVQQRVLELRFGFDGAPPRSLAEVAREMGKSMTTVQAAQREALRTLRFVLHSDLV